MNKITYAEMTETFRKFNNDNNITSKGGTNKRISGVIVFSQNSFDKSFSEFERSYRLSSDNKAFIEGMISNSIFMSSLDGTDINVRLDWYIDEWEIEYCYLEN